MRFDASPCFILHNMFDNFHSFLLFHVTYMSIDHGIVSQNSLMHGISLSHRAAGKYHITWCLQSELLLDNQLRVALAGSDRLVARTRTARRCPSGVDRRGTEKVAATRRRWFSLGNTSRRVTVSSSRKRSTLATGEILSTIITETARRSVSLTSSLLVPTAFHRSKSGSRGSA